MPKSDRLFKLRSDVSMFFHCLKKYGLARTIVLVKASIYYRMSHFEGIRYDSRFAVDTNQVIHLEDLTTPANYTLGTNYVGSSPLLFRHTIAMLPNTPSELVFIDIGCGAGRAVMLAAEANFKSIIGWDIARELIDMGRRNIEAFRRISGNKTPISLDVVDATKAAMPDASCVLYFFSPPYPDPVLTACLHNAHQSYQRNPRPMFLILINDHNPRISLDFPYLTRVQSARSHAKAAFFRWLFSANVFQIR